MRSFGDCRRWTRCSRRPPLRGLLERAPRWAVVAAVRGEIERLRAEIVGRAHRRAVDVDAAHRWRGAGRRRCSSRRCSRWSTRPAWSCTPTSGGRRWPSGASARVAAVARGYTNLEYRLDERRRGSRHEHVARAAGDADRRRGRAGGQQLRGGGAAGAVAAGGRARRGRVARRAGRDRRLVPRARRDARVGGAARRGRHDQSHARARLRGGDRPTTTWRCCSRCTARTSRSSASPPRSSVERAGRARRARAACRRWSTSARARSPICARCGLGGPSEPTVPRAGGARAPTSSPSAATSCSAGRRRASSSGGGGIIAAMRAHPLLRAVRPDKLTLAALEATLELYRDGRAPEIPALAMLPTPEPTLEARAAARWRARLRGARRAGARLRAGARALGRRRRRAADGGAVVVGGRRQRARRRRPVGRRARRAPAPRPRRRWWRASPTIDLLLDVRTLGDDDLPAVARAFEETTS